MNILPSKGSGVKGGMFGEDARKNSDGTIEVVNEGIPMPM